MACDPPPTSRPARWSARSSGTSGSSRTVAYRRRRDRAAWRSSRRVKSAWSPPDIPCVTEPSQDIRPEDIGTRLRTVRELPGARTGDVAKSAGLSRRELQAAERGAKRLSADQLHALAGALSVDPDVLVGV